MFSFLLVSALSLGSLDIRELMQGYWKGYVSQPVNNFINMNQYKLNVTNIEKSHSANYYLIDAETNQTVKKYIATYLSKTMFELFEGNVFVARIDLSPLMMPKGSCSGKWEDSKMFNAALVNAQTINLHIFDTHNKEWHFYTFLKDIDAMDLEPNTWKDTLFGWGFLAFTMVLAYLVSSRVQKCVHNRTLKKALQILKDEEEEEKKKKKKNK